MKKIKLFALAIMAMLSTNAFAADPVDITAKVAGTDGVVYAPVVDGKAPLIYTITSVKATAATAGTFVSGEVSVMENGAEMKELTEITIPDDVDISISSTALAAGTVTGKFKVTAIVNGDGTANAFTATNSNKLATVNIGANVKTIGKNAFKAVATLTSVTFGAAVETIGESAFEQTKIATLTLPASLQTIGAKAFYGNGTNYPTFSTVAIPATVWAIGSSAFEGCENLSTVTLAASSKLYQIGNGAFAYTSLSELDLSNATEYNPTPATASAKTGMVFFGEDGADFGPFTSSGAHALTSLIAKVVLPTTCRTIYSSAFKGLQYLSEIDLKNVTTIGANAFNGCKALAAVAIGTAIADNTTGFNGVAIGANAFEGCVKLATVEVGKIGTSTIDDAAFGTTTKAGVKTFKFNTIAAALGTSAWNLPTVTTLYFQKYIATVNYVPAASFTNAFDATAEEKDYHVYYNVTLPTDVTTAAQAINAAAFSSSASDERIITLHTSEAVQTAYGSATAINKVTISGDFSGAFTIGAGEEGSKKLIKDKNSSNYYYYYKATAGTAIPKEQESGANVTVYQAYTDGAGDEVDIYLMPLQVKNGKYGVAAGQVVIIKSNKENAVEAGPGSTVTMLYAPSGASSYAIANDLKITTAAKSKLAVMSDGELLANGAKEVWFFNNPATSGFGFTKYDASKQNGLGANTVYFQTAVSAAAPRLNIIWLDEEGNTTAIQKVELENTSINNDAIYNVAGQKVSASYKGLVIKGGKKYIQK